MDHQVAIVGAGPAGALLAWILSSRGIETLLIERQSDFDREFRGEILMPSGLRALEAAAVDLEPVEVVPIDALHALMNGRRFAELDLSALERPVPSAISQPSLLEHLVSLAEGTGRFELRRGAVVRRVERRGDGVHWLHLRDDEGESTIETRLLVGADGRGAVTRRALQPRVVRRGVDIDVVWFRMPYPESWPRRVAQFMAGKGQLLIATAAAYGMLQIGWVLLKGAYGELKSRSIDEWVETLRSQAAPELAAHLLAHREEISRPFLLNTVADRVVGWAQPGALLIGDAAHTMSPVGGQGVNIALRDAIVAANELVPALSKGRDVDVAAARVESLRGPEVDRIQRMQAIPPRIVMGRSVVHELARRALPLLIPPILRRFGAAGGAEMFLNGVTEVDLTV